MTDKEIRVEPPEVGDDTKLNVGKKRPSASGCWARKPLPLLPSQQASAGAPKYAYCPAKTGTVGLTIRGGGGGGGGLRRLERPNRPNRPLSPLSPLSPRALPTSTESIQIARVGPARALAFTVEIKPLSVKRCHGTWASLTGPGRAPREKKKKKTNALPTLANGRIQELRTQICADFSGGGPHFRWTS